MARWGFGPGSWQRPSARVQQDSHSPRPARGPLPTAVTLTRQFPLLSLCCPNQTFSENIPPGSQRQGCGPPCLKQDAVKGVPKGVHLEAGEATASFNSPGRLRRLAVGLPICLGQAEERPDAGSRAGLPRPCLLAGNKDEGYARNMARAHLGSAIREPVRLHSGCWHRPGGSPWAGGRADSPASDTAS